MNRSGEPLRHMLDARVDERRIHAAWQGISARIHARPRGRAPVLAIGGATLLLAALAIAVLLREPGPRFLALADGTAPTAVRSENEAVLAFADGSTVALHARASIVPIRNDDVHFELALERGAARFSVRPGGSRRWTIDAGLATVEVVGTVFSVARELDRVRVAVERGSVRVRAPWGVRELGAGESFEVRAPEPAPSEAAPEPPRRRTPTLPTPAPEAPSGVARPAENGRARTASRWTSFASEGAYAQAYDALGPGGTAREIERASPRELLLLADVARLSGHPSEALEPLQRLIDGHPRDPNAPIAAIVLARIEQDELGRPREAAAALERAITLGVPASFEADVRSRLALAWLDAGDPRGEESARAYVAAHPDGPRAALLRSRLE